MRCLTARQQAVFVLIAKGFRNREIAGHLGLSERTIKGYVSALLLVFEATNRTELVGLLSGGGATSDSLQSELLTVAKKVGTAGPSVST